MDETQTTNDSFEEEDDANRGLLTQPETSKHGRGSGASGPDIKMQNMRQNESQIKIPIERTTYCSGCSGGPSNKSCRSKSVKPYVYSMVKSIVILIVAAVIFWILIDKALNSSFEKLDKALNSSFEKLDKLVAKNIELAAEKFSFKGKKRSD